MDSSRLENFTKNFMNVKNLEARQDVSKQKQGLR